MCPSKRTSLASAQYSWLDCLFIREVDMPSSIDIGPVEGQVDAYASDGLDEKERNMTMGETCKVRGSQEINSKEILCQYH
jgi:hypothetical protein